MVVLLKKSFKYVTSNMHNMFKSVLIELTVNSIANNKLILDRITLHRNSLDRMFHFIE